ncbi:MAG: DMT family transporter [Bacillota bacterium]|nr:DMT family transporter [Bacillota bacterium]MDW7684873.1 DMT family transporter [Bacillota bacterium]
MHIETGYAKVLAASFIWGTLGAFARWSGLLPFELSFFRLLVAALTLFAVLPREQRLIIFYTRQYPLVFISGLLFAVDCLLFFHALKLTTLSNAVLPYNMQPVIIAVLAPVFLRESLRPVHIRALVLSLVGLGLLIYPSLTALSYQDLLGLTLALGGAFCLSVIALIIKALDVRASTFVYYMTVIATVCLLPFTWLISPSSLGLHSILLVSVIGLIHTAVAYILYYSGLRSVNTQYAAALTYFIPVVAVLSGVIFFGEHISFFTLTGGTLIIINSITVLFS